jgi:L-lactate dehydrogenase
MPLSTLIDGYLGVSDVCLSVPVVVGRRGIERTLQPPLDPDETAAFQHCARVVREAIATAGG